MPDNRGNIVKVLQGQDATRRVAIVRRPDGYYALRPERWYQTIWEGKIVTEGWAPTDARSGIFETADLAEKEAVFDFPWLS